MSGRARLAAFFCFLASWCFAGPARADVAIHADGRRTEVREPRADSRGRFTGEIEGRRTPLDPGEFVAVVDDKGRETPIPRPLLDGARTAADEAALTSLRDPRDAAWETAVMPWFAAPKRSVLEALVETTKDKRPAVRRRALSTLVRLRAAESVRAAAEAILAETDKSVRGDCVSGLYSVCEIYRRAKLDELTKRGLEDKDAVVRFTFAWLAPDDMAAAVDVLKKDGLANSDHHLRESAAMALARHGDASGESTMLGMLARDRMPGVDDRDLATRLSIAEKVEICELLGRLGTKTGLAALERAAKSPHEAVRAAAERALTKAKSAAPTPP